MKPKKNLMIISAAFFSIVLFTGSAFAVHLINEDAIIKGSECLGMDCPDTYSFGSDTLVFKENNLRIFFDDTSTSSNFPRNDWRITINSQSNGGLEKFSIDDVTNLRSPFTIEAKAKAYSLYIDNENSQFNTRIGLGTNAPATILHAVDGNTPTLRLEQNSSNGWTPQTWDVGSNESNFFIRDTTHSSRLPFRVFPSAATNSLTISSTGKIGMGIQTAAASLHIKKTGLTGTDNMVLMENDSLAALKLDGIGNLTVAGTLSHGSSRFIKKEIEPITPKDILAKLLRLEIYTWQYITDDNITHLGPMAEDFGDLFDLGADNLHIAPGDMGGIAFAGIKALNEKIEEKEDRINVLESENQKLKKKNREFSERLTRLESIVESLGEANKRDYDY